MASNVTATLTLETSMVEGHGRGRVIKEYSIAFSAGSLYPAGGIPIDFQGADPNGNVRSKFARIPDGFEVLNPPAGWLAKILPGVAFDDWKLELRGGEASGVALATSGGSLALDSDTSCRIRLSGVAV